MRYQNIAKAWCAVCISKSWCIVCRGDTLGYDESEREIESGPEREGERDRARASESE
jgi:hypothetical protein